MGSFNYNQLNVVGRDKDSIMWLCDALRKELLSLQSKVSTSSDAFKKVVQVANEVWSGDDKELFIKNLTASATEFEEKIHNLQFNIIKYFSKDLGEFNQLQKSTTNISNKKF